MKNLVGITLGALLAVAIGCAAKQPRMASSPASAPNTMAAGPPQPAPTTEIDRLDAQITADMASLGVARPTAPPLTCAGATCAQQMSGAAATAVAPVAPTCKPSTSQTCTDVCNLKDNICKASGRICQLASDLGGTDDHANDRCNQGNASCEAAKQRCCGCL